MNYLSLGLYAVLANNILLIQYMGNCSFLGTSKRMDTAIGMSMAVVFVLTLSGVFTSCLEIFVLQPFDLVYMRTPAYILVIASMVQFVEFFLKKSIPALYSSLGIYLPLITTNCAVLGTCLMNVRQTDFMAMLISTVGYPSGFALALILFAGIRERILVGRVPKPMQGTAIGLVTAGLMSLSFFAFKGLIKVSGF